MKAVTKASAERGEGNLGWVLSAVGLFSLICAGLMIIPFGPQMPQSGLDNSWTIALNEALAHGYVFGRDLIFAFGPLGPVYTHLYSPETDHTMMTASAVFAIGFCCAFWLAAYPRRLAFLIVIPFSIALSYSRDPIFLTIPFALLVGVARLRLPPESKWHVRATPVSLFLLALASITVAIIPLVKGSFVVSSVFTCALALVLLLTWRRDIALCFLGLIIATQVIAWMGAGQPIGYLLHFYIAQAPIIDGYTAAMSFYGNEKAPILYVVMALMLLGVTYRYFAKQSGLVGVIVMLGMLANLFLIFKAGFVRHDGHASMSAMSLIITACTLLSLLPIRIGSFTLGASAVVAMLIVGMIGSEGFRHARNSAIYNVSSTIAGIETRIARPDSLRPSYENAMKAIAEKTPLPRVSGSVDIYPIELSAVFGNRLNWSGRPVFQSYAAYTPELIKENAEHLDDARAPQTVFFTFFPIDRRMPSTDDSLSLVKLLTEYDVSSYSAPYIQFDRVNGKPGAALQLDRSVNVSTTNGKEVTVPFDGPTWVSIDVQPSLIGRIADKAYKAPEIYIALTLKGGDQIEHRFIPGIGAAGFILSPYLGTPEDLINLAAGLSSSATVKSFRIETKWPQFWKPSIVVKFTPIQIARHTGARKVALVEPSMSAPEAVKDGIANTQCAIDMVNGSPFHGDDIHVKSDNTLSAQGWIATPEGMQADEFKTWIVATSATGEKRHFEAKPFARPDVAKALNRADLVNSGFTSMLDTSSLVGPQTLELVTASKTTAFRCPSAISLH